MKNLLEKELELIKPILKDQVKDVLQNGFQANCGNSIIKVIGINLGEIFVDTKNSNFRENILINRLKLKARVKLNHGANAFKESTLSLKLNNSIHLTYNRTVNQYKVINGTHFKFIDLNNN